MKWLAYLWERVWNWLAPKPPLLCTVRIEELPEVLEARTIYLVGEKGYLWFAAFGCPCSCGETVFLNLLPEQRPCWKIENHADGTVSLAPSIWGLRNCRSHFFIRRSRIDWCA